MHGRVGGSPGWRRTVSWVVALAALLLTGIGATAASAAPTPISAGDGLDWGVKESWRNYIGAPGTLLSDGVTRNDDGTFHFPVAGGSYDPDTRTTVVRFDGTLLFLSHCEGGRVERPCSLDMTLSSPRVEITEDGAFLYARMASRPIDGGEIVDHPDVRLAALDVEDATPVVAGGRTAWSELPARMALEGSEVFTYGVGTVIDPVSFGYDGPGGKPAGEQFSEPGAPAYHREAVGGDGSTPLPRMTHPGRTADELLGVHWGSSLGVSLIDRATFAPLPGSHLNSNLGAFGSIALDPASATVFAGRGSSLSARHWDGAAWVDDQLDGSSAAGASIGGGVWDPVGAGRYLVSRLRGGVSELWEVRRVDGVWTAAPLGAVELTNGLPAPLMQQIVSVPDGNPATQRALLATWHGQIHRLHLLADGVVAEPLAQAGGIAASRLIPVRDGLYAVNASSVSWLPLTGTATNRRLAAAERAIAIPSPGGLEILDSALVTSDFERSTLYLPSHNIRRVARIEAGRLRHFFPLPGQDQLLWGTNALAGTTAAGHLVITGTDGATPPADALVYDTTAPSFTTQPIDTAVALPAGQTTGSARLSVAVDGDPAPTVRWQSRVPGVSRWADLTSADGVSGQDGLELTITAGAGHGGREYRAIASSSAGRVASARVTLDVRTPPAVSVQPDSVSVIEGAPAQLKVMPLGNPEPTITWQQRGGGFWHDVDPTSGDFEVDGGFLTVVDPVVAMSGTQFRARLVNEVGTVFTRPVTLTVAAALTEPVTFGGGHVDWGIAERWRCYVVGNVARGQIEVSGGIERIPGTLASGTLCNSRNAGSEALRFPVRGGSYDPASGRLEVTLGGAVRFWGHDHHVPGDTRPQLDTRFSNLRLVVEGGVGTLYADAVGATMESPEPRTHAQVALVRVELGGASPARTAAGLAWSALPTVLTADGAVVFGSYPAGEAFDPISLDLAFGEPRGPEQPPVDGPPTGMPPSTQPPVVAPPVVAPPVVTPPPLLPPTRRSAPRATFTVPRRALTLDARRRATVATIACARGRAACAVQAPRRVQVRIAGRRYTAVVVAPRRIAAGRRAALRVRLSKPATARLAGRRATVRVTVTVRSGGVATRRTLAAQVRAAAARSPARR